MFINPVMQMRALSMADIETHIQPFNATLGETSVLSGVFAIPIADAASNGILIEVLFR